MMKKILLVEDSDSIVKGLKYALEQENFEIIVARSLKEVSEQIDKPFDLVILDVMLPDGATFDLCSSLKEEKGVPVIFLTARDDESDVVLGFDKGADDYVVKPFRPRELISRINRLLKNGTADNIKVGKVMINVPACKVFINDVEVNFTALEYRILLLFFTNVGKVVTRELILDRIWDDAGNFVNDNTLTVYVKRIREKLGEENVIKTVKGIGYRVDE